jgi:hypothetical protein
MVKRLRSPEVQEKIKKANKEKARSSETTQESPRKVLEPSLEEMMDAPVESDDETVDEIAPKEGLWSKEEMEAGCEPLPVSSASSQKSQELVSAGRDFRNDDSIREALKSLGDWVSKTVRDINGMTYPMTKGAANSKCLEWLGMAADLRDRTCAYYVDKILDEEEARKATEGALASQGKARSEELERMPPLKSRLVTALTQLRAQFPENPQFLEAHPRKEFPVAQEPRSLLDGLRNFLRQEKEQRVDDPIKTTALQMAKDLNKKGDYTTPNDIIAAVEGFFTATSGMEENVAFMDELQKSMTERNDSNHARIFRDAVRTVEEVEGSGTDDIGEESTLMRVFMVMFNTAVADQASAALYDSRWRKPEGSGKAGGGGGGAKSQGKGNPPFGAPTRDAGPPTQEACWVCGKFTHKPEKCRWWHHPCKGKRGMLWENSVNGKLQIALGKALPNKGGKASPGLNPFFAPTPDGKNLKELTKEEVDAIAEKAGKMAKGKMAEMLLNITEVEGTAADVANPHRDSQETVPQLPPQENPLRNSNLT